MRLLSPLILLAIYLLPSFSISQTSLSGIINHYSSVTSIQTGSNQLTLTNATDFLAGERILIIQMQGAQIDDSQTASFGNIQNINTAGAFEIHKICSKAGNMLTLANEVNSPFNSNQVVQVVSFPTFNNVSLNGDILAAPFDGFKGGIVALEVLDTLSLNGFNVDVSSTGFMGGQALTSGNNCVFVLDNSYYTSQTSTDELALKGAGISATIVGKECGRGPQANGGGGGNNHNGGGSGGANFGFGGKGGQRIKSGPFNCGSVEGLDSYGIASFIQGKRLFLGGGGGAGHGNNAGNTGESGGNGGGIVFLHAKTIVASGGELNATGQSLSANSFNEGGGGGGAGGSIYLQANQLLDAFNVNVSGGNGASTDNGGNTNCNGPGGGGGGGYVITDSSFGGLLNVTFQGGMPGVIATTGQANCPLNGTNGAVSGAPGSILSTFSPIDLTFPSAVELADSFCATYRLPSGTEVNSSGVYRDTIFSNLSCDTIFQYTLTKIAFNTQVITGIDSLAVVHEPNTVYSWIDCSTLSPVGLDSNVYFPSYSGTFAVIANRAGCTDTSACVDFEMPNSFKPTRPSVFKIWPNPTTGLLTLECEGSLQNSNASIYSMQGVLLVTLNNLAQRKVFDISRFKPGTYLIRIKTAEATYTERVIIASK